MSVSYFKKNDLFEAWLYIVIEIWCIIELDSYRYKILRKQKQMFSNAHMKYEGLSRVKRETRLMVHAWLVLRTRASLTVYR